MSTRTERVVAKVSELYTALLLKEGEMNSMQRGYMDTYQHVLETLQANPDLGQMKAMLEKAQADEGEAWLEVLAAKHMNETPEAIDNARAGHEARKGHVFALKMTQHIIHTIDL